MLRSSRCSPPASPVAPVCNPSVRVWAPQITDLSAVALAEADHRFTDHSIRAGFTLFELLIVVGIIGLLMVLIAPAFTTIKGGTDVTSAAYTIKGVLDTARTYAKANNTYTWVGFYEEDVAQPSVIPAPGTRTRP